MRYCEWLEHDVGGSYWEPPDYEDCDAFATGPDMLCDHHRAEQLRVRAEDLAALAVGRRQRGRPRRAGELGRRRGSYELGAEYTPAGLELAQHLTPSPPADDRARPGPEPLA